MVVSLIELVLCRLKLLFMRVRLRSARRLYHLACLVADEDDDLQPILPDEMLFDEQSIILKAFFLATVTLVCSLALVFIFGIRG